MALTERTVTDLIEIVGPYKHIQIRDALIIERDGVEISRSFNRYSLTCGVVGAGSTFIDTDISNQPDNIQAICNICWTPEIKEAWKQHLISTSPTL